MLSDLKLIMTIYVCMQQEAYILLFTFENVQKENNTSKATRS